MNKKTTLLVFLLISVLQHMVFAMGGKTYYRIALNRINAKLEYLEKNIKK